LLNVLKRLKRFLLNKLPNLISVDDPYGVPNDRNQTLLKESFILDELTELMDEIWPDENYMIRDFSSEQGDSK
jgi:hypothetical protein